VGVEEDLVGMAVTGASILGLTGKAHQDFVATVDRHALSMQPLDLEVEIRRQGGGLFADPWSFRSPGGA
jgi:hypothetical protein